MRVERGEFVTLLGPSGCGKTTTLRMVAGLEQNTSGRISIGGRVVSDADAGFFVPPDHRQLGMVFQSYAIWPHMTVFDNVAYPLRIRRKSKAEIKQSASTRRCGWSRWRSIAERPAPALSGGQQQRVAIARALVFEPEVLAARRAVVQSRCAAAHADGRRVPRAAEAARHHQPLRHPRPGGGDGAVRPRRGDAGRAHPADRRAGGNLSAASSRAVAAFFGSPNLLDAKVTACEARTDQKFELTVAGNNWTGRCFGGEPFAAGEPVLVLVRPENMHIGPNGSSGSPMAWSGRITSSIFRGPRQSMVVEAGGLKLNVEAPALLGARIGDEIRIEVPPVGAWAIRIDTLTR